MKKLVAFILVLALCLSLCSVTAFADEPCIVTAQFTNSYFAQDYDNGYVKLEKTGEESGGWTFGFLVTPNDEITISGNSITYGEKTITAVVLSKGVSAGYAFEGWYINDIKQSDGTLTITADTELNPSFTIATTIAEIDLSNIKFGEGWAGKTVEAVLPSLANIEVDNCIVKRTRLAGDDPTQLLASNYTLTANESVWCELILEADSGYAFPFNSEYGEQTYTGTVTVPQSVFYNEDAEVGSLTTDNGPFSNEAGSNQIRILIHIPVTAASLTIDDILKTAKGGFPTSKENAWVSEGGARLYRDSNEKEDPWAIWFSGDTSYGVEFEKPVTPDGNNYKYIEEDADNDGNEYITTVTFNMSIEGKLVSVTFDNDLDYNNSLNGTYKAPTGDDGHDWDYETLAKGAAIAAGITVVTVGTIHTVKAIKNYKAEKAAAAEAAKIAEMPMVAIGSSGDAVTTLQTELNAQGYDCGEVDGIFGQNTLNAVIAFQTANGLAADGIVGELTWGALL